MPTQLDQVSATVDGKNKYVCIRPTRISVLTSPGAMSSSVQVVLSPEI